MATHVQKKPIKAPPRRGPKRGTAAASRETANAKAPAPKITGAKSSGIMNKVIRNKPKIVPFDKAKDQVEREKIAATFDLAAFEAARDQTSEETAKEWSKPY
jgi:hypothetical protein